jgi:hypothetical protein
MSSSIEFNRILDKERDLLSISYLPEEITTQMLYYEMNGSSLDNSEVSIYKNDRLTLWRAYYITVICCDYF